MRLLDTSTPQPELTEFFGNAIPVYAILSHTWGDGEVSYHDLQYSRDKAEKKAGYQKIKESCEIASQYGYRYVWIDTCCIDKTSSAELSEAINSMFGYYRDCRICLAYLSDVASQEDPKRQASAFRRSRWFKRGWTLQELLAPPSLVFFSQDWMDIGTKSSLRNVVSEVTRIPVQVLMNNHPETISIAKRMSWAADRKTTRAEDLAYCLMGIFDVHMPTLYGEGGPNAFMRLQQEIIRKSDDQSIFAWTAPGYECGPFASSPSAFSYTGDVQVWNPGESEELQSPYTMTNLGLRIELLLIHRPEYYTLAVLNCHDKGMSLGIYLRQVEGNRYVRASPELLEWRRDRSGAYKEEVYIMDQNVMSMHKWIRPAPLISEDFKFRLCPSLSNFQCFAKSREITPRVQSVLLKRSGQQEAFVVLVGVQEHIWAQIITGGPLVEELTDNYKRHESLVPSWYNWDDIQRLWDDKQRIWDDIQRLWDAIENAAIRCRFELADRREERLNSEEIVSVSVREIWVSSPWPQHTPRLLAEIDLRPSKEPSIQYETRYKEPSIPPEYDFLVTWAQTYATKMKEVFPKNIRQESNKASIFLPSAVLQEGTPYILVFDHKETGKSFAIALGLSKPFRVWTDIFLLHAQETAEDVWKRIRSTPEADPTAEKLASTSLMIGEDMISVRSGKRGFFAENHHFWAEILDYGSFHLQKEYQDGDSEFDVNVGAQIVVNDETDDETD